MHCCCVLIRTLALARLSCFTSDNDAVYRHRLAFMLYAYRNVKKTEKYRPKNTENVTHYHKFIGDELISDKSIFGFYKFC